jgi:glutamate synthase domain-containing protein 3
MKQFKDKKPTIVYGGRVKQYCGEYMAGGTIIVLGLNYRDAVIDRKKPVSRENIDPKKIKEYPEPVVQSYLVCGMHGGVIYVRGAVPESSLGIYAVKDEFTDEDKAAIAPQIKRFSELFNVPDDLIWNKKYTKIRPISSRPFGKVYISTPI